MQRATGLEFAALSRRNIALDRASYLHRFRLDIAANSRVFPDRQVSSRIDSAFDLGVEPVFPEKDQAINDAENRASFRSGETRLAWLGHFLIPLPALIFQFDVLDRDRVRISIEVGKYLIF